MTLRRCIFLGLTVLASAAVLVFGYRHHLVGELRKPVLAQLSDPGSALFADERYVGNWTVSGGYLCGRINAKNKMGGYVGYRWFESNPYITDIESDVMRDVLDKSGTKRCDEDTSKGAPWWWLTR